MRAITRTRKTHIDLAPQNLHIHAVRAKCIPQSAGGMVACRSVSGLMPPVIAVGGTRLVPPPAMGMPSSPRVVACGGGQPTMHVGLK